MKNISLNIKITGKAGEGVMIGTKLLARSLQRLGLEIFIYYEYPSLIKGGYQTGQIYAANDVASCQKRFLDILILFDSDSILLHQAEINEHTIVISEFANNDSSFNEYQSIKAKFINCPLQKISLETTGAKISVNAVANGAASYLAGLKIDEADLHQIAAQEFADKTKETQQKAVKAFLAGFNFAKKISIVKPRFDKNPQDTILLTGNEAIGLGAIAGGLQYYSAYPMTPASGLMHFLAQQQTNFSLIVKHVEDEIAAVNQAIGAFYAGVKAMTGSAGGGFALMVESLSMVGVAEVPLVILAAQRGAPGSGLPTWTSQADLQFVLRAGHGDFQRIILTPGSVAEHFEAGKQALYLAEKYQVPVIILSDKYILESYQTMPKPAEEYKTKRESLAKNLPTDGSYLRYKVTDNGISPRSTPGQDNGLAITNSYEHDEFGFATEEIKPVIAQVKKRQRKEAGILAEIPKPVLFGPKKAEYTFVGWGSTVNVFKQLVFNLEKKESGQKKVNAIHLPCAWPFPSNEFKNLTNKASNLVMVEGNSTAQAAQLIRQETGIEITEHILRFDGRPFYVEDLLEWLNDR